jgi:hypothetical protein
MIEMIDKLVDNYLIVIPIILTLILLILTIWKIDKKERFKFIAPILVSLLFLLLSLFFSTDKDPDYFQKNRPYLEIKLVIENSDSEGFHYYYLIKNIGQLPAENINFTFLAPSVKGTELIPPVQRMLAPNGGEMKYMPQPLKMKIEELKEFNSFVLIISYNAKIKGEIKYFTATYRNIVPINISDGNYTYDEYTLEEKVFAANDKMEKIEFFKIEENLSRFQGISINMLIKLNSNNEVREKYIYDLGEKIDSKRVSIYLDESNYLNFRIISAHGEIKAIKLNLREQLDKTIFLNVEIGRKNNYSFTRIGLNGEWMIRDSVSFNTAFIENDNFLKTAILGADINGKNGGFFNLGELVIYSSTLTYSILREMNSYFFKKFSGGNQGSVLFKGKQWLYYEGSKNKVED